MNNHLKLFLILLLLSIAGCTKLDPLGSQTDDEQLATLTSLKKINDYPFYTMIYYGDYGLKNYLNNPSNQLPSSNTICKNSYMCTCFTAKGIDSNPLFGRNLDSDSHAALLLYTYPKDGYASMSMVFLAGLGYSSNHSLDAAENRATLLASPFWPVDGINECGVAIGCMSVDKVEPPYNPQKKTLNRMVIIRLVLDYAKDVNNAIELLNKYSFDFPNDPNHYLICDATGNSAVIEFLENEMKVIRSNANWQVSTNTILYGTQLQEIANFKYTDAISQSKWRYAKVYETLKATMGTVTPERAMTILNTVSANFGAPYNIYTMWSAVYNLKTCEMDIVINRKFSEVQHFSLSDFRKN